MAVKIGYVILLVIVAHWETQHGNAEEGIELCRRCNCKAKKQGSGPLWVDCSYRELQTIPRLPYATKEGVIERLDLTYNNIIEIKEGTFNQTTGLKILALDNNQIEKIPESLFNNTPALEELHIYNNKIKVIPDNLFARTPKIKKIELHANKIKDISQYLFYNTPHLAKLDLSRNQITTIPRRLFHKVPELSRLDLSDNRITTLPRDLFSETPQLSYLELENNSITSIPLDLFKKASKIEHLLIQYNSLGVISPVIFDSTPNLKALSTSGFTDCCNAKRMTGNSIKCYYNKKEMEIQNCGVRIISMNTTAEQNHSGIVEVYDYETRLWKQVCYNENWSLTDAHVVCRDLNFEEAIDTFGVVGGRGQIFLKDYFCNGKEDYLMTCITEEHQSNCTSDEVARVRCKVEGEMLSKVCNSSGTSIDCSRRHLYFMPWVNETRGYYKYGNVTRYDISHNKVQRIWKGNLAAFPRLKTLDLSFNHIREIPDDFFFYTRKLRNLNFSNNKIEDFPPKILADIPHLVTLDLSNNELEEFSPSMTSENYELKILNLSGNRLKSLGKEIGLFRSLEILDISKMKMLYISDWNFLKDLVHLKKVAASAFDQCCYVKKFLRNATCEAPVDGVSDCDTLIKDSVFRTVLWIVMVIVIVANVIAFLVRLIIRDGKNSLKIFILNLMVSDFLMGVFLAGILHKHISVEGEYFEHDNAWRNSLSCKAFGLIGFLSSEISLATLSVIAYTRYRSVIHGFSEKLLSMRCALRTVCAIWIVCLCAVFVPVIVDSYFYNPETRKGFYGVNALCLPLHLPGEKETGWEYCFAIFGCVNLIIVGYIVVTYSYMTYKVITDRPLVLNSRRKEDTYLTIRVSLIIITDILCWIPVITLLFLSLAGLVTDEEDVIYRWFVVCVFPLNSAINPLVYTFLSPKVSRKLKQGVLQFCCRRLYRLGGNRPASSHDFTLSFHRSTQVIEWVDIGLSSPISRSSATGSVRSEQIK